MVMAPKREVFVTETIQGSIKDNNNRKYTDHYQITKSFLDNPDLYLRNLFSDDLNT